VLIAVQLWFVRATGKSNRPVSTSAGISIMWFTETPWPPFAICVGIGAFLLYRFWTTQRATFLVAALVLSGLSSVIFFIEQAIVTEAEQIEANVLLLADAVEQGDVEATLRFLSPREEQMRSRIGGAMAMYDIDDLRITDLHVRMQADNSIGISHFRANGTVSGKASGVGTHVATRWELTWRRVEDDWKITEVTRLHPIRDNETIPLFESPK
jgi:ketosteroid isomerase-like protein